MARARPISEGEADRVSASLDALAGMDAAALERRWRQLFGTAAPPSLPPARRARVIAYRLQALAYGDLDRYTAQALDQLARAREQASQGGDASLISVPVPDRGTAHWRSPSPLAPLHASAVAATSGDRRPAGPRG